MLLLTILSSSTAYSPLSTSDYGSFAAYAFLALPLALDHLEGGRDIEKEHWGGTWWHVEMPSDRTTAAHWVDAFRMDRTSFDMLCDELAPHLVQSRGPRVDVRLCTAVALHICAHNTSHNIIQKLFGIGKIISHKYFTITISALVKIRKAHVYWPTTNKEFKAKAKRFRAHRGFPNVVGAIDGSHVKINEQDSLDWLNRKGYYSMLVQAICDFDMIFMDLVVGWPGSVHDARVFRNSGLHERGITHTLFPTTTSCRFACGMRVPWCILGDSAYPLLSWLLTPFKDNGHLSSEYRFYNYVHSSTRMVIERAFGRLKCRWAILKDRCDTRASADRSTFEAAADVITACVVLHNYVQRRHPEFHEFLGAVDPDGDMPHQENQAEVPLRTPTVVRTRYKHFINRNTLCLRFRRSRAARQSIQRRTPQAN